jgi:hypothetical protein
VRGGKGARYAGAGVSVDDASAGTASQAASAEAIDAAKRGEEVSIYPAPTAPLRQPHANHNGNEDPIIVAR